MPIRNTANRFIGILAGALLVLLGPALAHSQPRQGKAAMAEGNPALLKVSSHLLEARTMARSGLSAAQIRTKLPDVALKNNQMDVEVRLKELTPDIVSDIRSLGLSPSHISFRYARIVGLLDSEKLDEIAAIPEVTTIHPNYGFILTTGSVDDQADSSIHADLARATFGVDGSGTRIGILSDSFNDTIGGAVAGSGCSRFLSSSVPQTSGDLPPTVTLLDNGTGGGTDEGAGMAELIHDLAPGADLLFHTAEGGEAAFAQGITDLANCGANVIVDDVIYFLEPMFQDGIVAQAAQDAVDQGVAYFSSAGNQATVGVDEQYKDGNPAVDDIFFPPTGNDFHDFGGGNEFVPITFPPGCGLNLVLQWNDPFSGTLGPGASSDLDLYFCLSQNAGDCPIASIDSQGCSSGDPDGKFGDPVEFISVINTGITFATGYLAVDNFCGDEERRFRIAVYGLGCGLPGSYSFAPGTFTKPQVYGHAAAAGATGVGAVFYGEIDSGGNVFSPFGRIDVESFSSLGGNLPFYFDGSGNPLPGAPMTRFKPEIAAPDGTNTSFFGGDISFDSDAFPNFFGTSAAAPHAAAVAGLLLDQSPDLAPAGIQQVLEASARDISTPGVDTLAGFGLVDSFDAVQTVSTTGTGCSPDLFLHDQTILGTQFFRACNSVVAGPAFHLSTGSTLTFKAGSEVILKDGFSVGTGGTFTAIIDPVLGP